VKQKSKLIVFLLSFLPGLSHFYVGFKERAIIFFLLFFGGIFGVVGITALTNEDDFLLILVIALPILWLVALVDALLLADRLNLSGEGTNPEYESLLRENFFTANNRKLIAVVLSIVPGAGHMYLGLQNQGLQFMSMFFFAAFLMGWLNMSLFLFTLPIIWFYSLFDAFHRVEEEKVVRKKDGMPIYSWLMARPQWAGWGLIILGCLVIFERIISPFLTWQIRNYIQTGLVALVLIVSGIRLLMGSKQVKEKEAEETCGNGE
jgi:hypothetical protein